MAFILGTLLFVIVVGLVDAGLPWPNPKSAAPNREFGNVILIAGQPIPSSAP